MAALMKGAGSGAGALSNHAAPLMSNFTERKRKENLTDDQVTALINIWEEFLPELRSQKRNACVYLKIVAALNEHGVHRSVIDVKNKIHNLTKEYRRERKKLDGEGSCSPSTWKFYNAVHRVIGSNPINVNATSCPKEQSLEPLIIRVEPYEVMMVQDMEIFPSAAESSPVDGGGTTNSASHSNVSDPVRIEENSFLGTGNSVYTESSADDTCSNSEMSSSAVSKRAGRRWRRPTSNESDRRETSILEAMLCEQKRSNARTERAMAKAEELDTRAVAMLEEYNGILRQSLEMQKAMLQLFADLNK